MTIATTVRLPNIHPFNAMDVTSAFALAKIPVGRNWLVSICTTGRSGARVAAGCESDAENGVNPTAFEAALASVVASVAAAPLVESWPTALEMPT